MGVSVAAGVPVPGTSVADVDTGTGVDVFVGKATTGIVGVAVDVAVGVPVGVELGVAVGRTGVCVGVSVGVAVGPNTTLSNGLVAVQSRGVS